MPYAGPRLPEASHCPPTIDSGTRSPALPLASNREERIDKSNGELAENRTELAEDRTLMAVERTMASWMSASFGAIGVGLGFRALFGHMDPSWIPRLIATLFFILAVVLVKSAERRMCRALGRLSSHNIDPASGRGLQIAAYGVITGAVILTAGIWLFYE